eukprot:TRINITY_DN4120_c0_g1_i1.p1 TRINITY_DN4120_c0_g1~~TRINITY_DN4120_c0_g1_i1.p1  ORF type:complete len:385 (+),score=54.34 TRINITY_DN4120_c0_g1_i1:757-1911(+)
MSPRKCNFDAGWLLVVLACVMIVLLFTFTIVFQKKQFSCVEDGSLSALFNPQPVGWLGADVSTSIHLYNGTMLWLFGDTMVGNLFSYDGNTDRNVTAFVHGTIALLDTKGTGEPNYYIRKVDGYFESFFHPLNSSTDPQEYYWTVSGLVLPKSNTLIILAMVIKSVNNTFIQLGSDAILVKNIYDDPYLWNYETSRITQSSPKIQWNVAIAINPIDGYVYIMGHDSTQSMFGCTVLSRISEDSLYNLNWADMQFWGKAQKWSSESGSLMCLIDGGVTETTLFYHSSLQTWYYVGLSGIDSNVILADSKSLTGPWSTQTLYTIPAPFSNNKVYTTYASKEHPEYETNSNEIVFTYNTNVVSFWGLWTDITAYHPIFLTCTQNYVK